MITLWVWTWVCSSAFYLLYVQVIRLYETLIIVLHALPTLPLTVVLTGLEEMGYIPTI